MKLKRPLARKLKTSGVNKYKNQNGRRKVVHIFCFASAAAFDYRILKLYPFTKLLGLFSRQQYR